MIDRWMSLTPFLKCRVCGKAFGSVRQLELLKSRQPLVKFYLEMCPECRGRSLGKAFLGPTSCHSERSEESLQWRLRSEGATEPRHSSRSLP
jgi:hypothetical protein